MVRVSADFFQLASLLREEIRMHRKIAGRQVRRGKARWEHGWKTAAYEPRREA